MFYKTGGNKEWLRESEEDPERKKEGKNRNLKIVSLIFLLTLFFFLPYFFEERFIEPDSYHFFNVICNDSVFNENSFESKPGIEHLINGFFAFPFETIVNLLPCNFLFIKLIYAGLLFGCLIVFWKIGEVFDKKDGWLLSLLVFLTWFPTEFLKFENDAFGYLFGLIGLYFLIKTGSKKQKLLGFLLICVGGLFWQGNIYWLIVSPIFFVYALPIVLLAIVFVWNNLFWFVQSNSTVLENQPIIGLIYLGLPVFFLIGFLETNKKIVATFILMLCIALFNAKLFVLCIPFLLIIAFKGIKMLPFDFKTIKLTIIIFCIMMLGFWWINQSNQFPTNQDIDLIKESIKLADGETINNTFGAGYVIEFYGGKPSQKGFSSVPPKHEGLVLEIIDANLEDCEEISKTSWSILAKCKK